MSKPKEEARGRDAAAPVVVRSDGAEAAHAYVEAEVPEEPRCPTMEMDRVRIVDPRRAPTMRREDMVKGDGPRAPEQMVKEAAAAPGVEAPMARPATKMQVLKIDPEFLTELKRKQAEAAVGGAEPEEAGEVAGERVTDPMPVKAAAGRRAKEEERAEPKPASPWTKDAPGAASELVRASALPSSLRPREVSEGAEEQAADGAAREKKKRGLVIVGAIVVVAIGIGVRAMMGGTQSTGQEPEVKGTSTVAASAPTAATATAVPVPTVEERVLPQPSSAPSTSAVVPVAPPSVVPAAERPHPTGKRAQPRGEDPYADAAPPVKTAAPAVTAAPVVTAAPSVTAPPPQKTATPPSSPVPMFEREP